MKEVTGIVSYVPNDFILLDKRMNSTVISKETVCSDFLLIISNDTLSHDDIEKEYLPYKVIDHAPSADGMVKNADTNAPNHLSTMFVNKLTYLFPIEHLLVNYRQLERYVSLFLKS